MYLSNTSRFVPDRFMVQMNDFFLPWDTMAQGEGELRTDFQDETHEKARFESFFPRRVSRISARRGLIIFNINVMIGIEC
jgi:hypothetical protein